MRHYLSQIENIYDSRIATPFEDDVSEEVEVDLTAVNETIVQLKLTEKQQAALQCMMDELSFTAAARIMNISKAHIWITIMRIQKKYIRIFSEPKLRVFH